MATTMVVSGRQIRPSHRKQSQALDAHVEHQHEQDEDVCDRADTTHKPGHDDHELLALVGEGRAMVQVNTSVAVGSVVRGRG